MQSSWSFTPSHQGGVGYVEAPTFVVARSWVALPSENSSSPYSVATSVRDCKHVGPRARPWNVQIETPRYELGLAMVKLTEGAD